MRWPKILLVTLAGLLAACVVLVVSVVLFIGHGNLREAVVYGVERATGHQLEIDGPLTVELSLSPTIKVSGLHFRMDNEAFEIEAGDLLLQVDLSLLTSGQLHVRDVRLSNSIITVRQVLDDEPAGEPFDLSALTIDHVDIENLSVDLYQSYEIEPLHIKLDVFQATRDADGIISPLTSRGTVDGEPFSLDGSLSRGAAISTGERPFILNFHSDVMHSITHIEGEVVRSAEATTVDLAVQLDVPDVTAVLALFHVGVPPLGTLTATGNLTGSLDALQLSNLESRLTKEGVNLTTKGSVANLNAGTGFDLEYAATITDAGLLAWLLPKEVPEFTSIQSAWKITGDIDHLQLVAEQLQATDGKGHRLNISGKTTILDTVPFLDSLQASVELSAPNLQYVRQFSEAVPKLGPVKASANVTLNDGVLTIQDIKATSTTGKTGRVNADGSIGHISFSPVEVSGMAFTARVEGVTAKQIGEAINVDLPDLGPVDAQAKYRGSMHKSTVSDLQLQAGSPGRLQLNASGDIKLGALDGDKPLAGMALDIYFEAPSTAQLSVITGSDVPAMGNLKGTARLSDASGVTGITSLEVAVNKGNDFRLVLSGMVADLENLDGVNIKVEMNAKDLHTLGAMFDATLPKEGQVKVGGRIKGSLEQVRFTGLATLRNTSISTDLTGKFTGDRPVIAGTIDIPELDIHDIGLHPERHVKDTAVASDEEEGFTAPVDYNPEETVPLFDKEPYDLSGLQTANLDLKINIKKLHSTDAAIENIFSHVLLQDGKLEVKPVRWSVDDDIISANLTINSMAKVPTAAIHLEGNNIDLGLFLTNSPEQPARIRGVMTLDADMYTHGRSQADVAANLNGTIHIVAENAKVKKSDMNLINLDVFGWFLSNMSLKKDVNIGCAIFSATFDKGIGKSDMILIDTPDTLIRIDASIDLTDETMYVAILPERKIKLMRSRKPMEIHGPITNPEYKLVSLKNLTLESSRAVLLSPLTITGTVLGNFAALLGTERESVGTCGEFISE